MFPRKPGPQAVDKSFAAPEWDWFWNSAAIVLDMNDRQTSHVTNWAFPQKWENNGLGPGIALGVGPSGLFMQGANSGFDISVLGPKSGEPTPPLTTDGDVSLFFAVEDLGAAQAGGQICVGGSTGEGLRIGGGLDVEVRLSNGNRFTSTGTVPSSGPFTLGLVISAGGPYRVYIDGVFDSGLESDTDFGGFGSLAQLFGRSGNSNRDIKLYAFYSFNDVLLSDGQFKQLHDDPFGPLRVADRPKVFVAAAAPAVVQQTALNVMAMPGRTQAFVAKTAAVPPPAPTAQQTALNVMAMPGRTQAFVAKTAAVAVVAAVDKGKDAGSGRFKERAPPWWTGEWIDPSEVYAPPKILETPKPKARSGVAIALDLLKAESEALRDEKLIGKAEYQKLQGRLKTLSSAAQRAVDVLDARDALAAKKRLQERLVAFRERLERLKAEAVERLRQLRLVAIRRDDDDVLAILKLVV